MKEQFSFTNPESGRKYTSENPIDAQAKSNTLFVEKLQVIDDLKRLSAIPRILLEAGPDAVAEFEEMLQENQKGLSDLLKIEKLHPAQQADAELFISEFFETTNKDKKKKLAEYLSVLCR
jgi:hypothetical protein